MHKAIAPAPNETGLVFMRKFRLFMGQGLQETPLPSRILAGPLVGKFDPPGIKSLSFLAAPKIQVAIGY